MTDSTEDTTPAPIGDSPGQHLAQVRQGRGLSIERIANELHLKPEFLQAVEEDAYDRLPSAVFVSGYIRAYARLLKIDPQPLIERFHRLHPNAEPPPPRATDHPARGVGGGHLLGRALVLGLAVAAIAGLGYWASISDWSQMAASPTATPEDPATTDPLFDADEPDQPETSVLPPPPPPLQPDPVAEPPTQAPPADTAVGAADLMPPPQPQTATQTPMWIPHRHPRAPTPGHPQSTLSTTQATMSSPPRSRRPTPTRRRQRTTRSS
jgi:cytoskeleton protein RodZ